MSLVRIISFDRVVIPRFSKVMASTSIRQDRQGYSQLWRLAIKLGHSLAWAIRIGLSD